MAKPSDISGPLTMSDLIGPVSSSAAASASGNNRNRPGCNINSHTFAALSSLIQGIRLTNRAGIVIRPASGLTTVGPNPISSIISHKIIDDFPFFAKSYLDITHPFPYDIQQDRIGMFWIPSILPRWTGMVMCGKLPELRHQSGCSVVWW